MSHTATVEVDEIHQDDLDHLTTRRLGLASCFAGVVIGVVSIAWSLFVWHFDELISPRGQITVACTSAAVVLIFMGVLVNHRANDRLRDGRLQRTRLQRLEDLTARIDRLEEGTAHCTTLVEQLITMVSTGVSSVKPQALVPAMAGAGGLQPANTGSMVRIVQQSLAAAVAEVREEIRENRKAETIKKAKAGDYIAAARERLRRRGRNV